MLTGSTLTLNFYSNTIDVLVSFDRTVYINVDDYRIMVDSDIPNPQEILRHTSEDELFIPFSYLIHNLESYLPTDANFAEIIRREFFKYIMNELAVIRALLPLVKLDYGTWERGVFDHDSTSYITESGIGGFIRNSVPVIPSDVPRVPMVISISSEARRFCTPRPGSLNPIWAIDLKYLTYVLSHNQREDWGIFDIPPQRADAPVQISTMLHCQEIDKP